MTIKIVTEPAAEPLSIFEVKDHLRLDHDEHTEDDWISANISGARQDCEGFQNRAYITQTWELWLDGWPDGNKIEIPLPPLQEPVVTAGSFVTGTTYRILSVGSTDFTEVGASASTVGIIFTATGAGTGTGTATASVIIKYYGTDDTEATFSPTYYFVDTKSEPGRVALNSGQSWPGTSLRPANGICVTYIAGYGDDGYDVPENIRRAILLLIGHLYENRETVLTTGMNVAELPLGTEALLWKDRIL